MNGSLMDDKDMLLSVRDLGILRGLGVFDFIRTYNNKPFHLEDHIKRLQFSAGQIGMKIPYSIAEIEQAMFQVLQHWDGEEAGLRIVCTVGSSLEKMTQKDGVNLFILADPLRTFPRVWYEQGVKVITYPHVRNHPEAKSVNYIAAMEASAKAREQGAEEALYMDKNGRVLEGTTSNLFLYKDGSWLTPCRDILKGVTRQVVMSLIGEEQLSCSDITLQDITGAQECFITSSSREILPVRFVNDYEFSQTPGPQTREMMEAFRAYVNAPEKWVLKE